MTPEPPDWCSTIEEWDLATRLHQLVMVGVTSNDAEETLVAVSGPSPVGGLFLFPGDGNLLRAGELQSVKTRAEVTPLVAVDDEGGRVQMLTDVSAPLPSAREQTNTMNPNEIRDAARFRGRALSDAGVDINFAPVVDVSAQQDDEVIGDRSYGTNAALVIAHAGAFAEGLREGGIMPTLKHFPGHGRAFGDSHDEFAVAPPIGDLTAVDLRPYEELLGPDTAVMTGHLDVPGLTAAGVPASLSPATYELLRSEFGFDGIAITDDLSNMIGVTSRFSTPEAAALALASGADMVLIGRLDQLDAVIDETTIWVDDGRLTEERVDDAVARVVKAKGCRP